jgi:tripartite-type tricarboxylate transporter receptor subunit TctC
MKLPRRRFLRLAAGAATLPAASRIAWAQAYPLRPITLVVPFPAGGPADVIGRILAPSMRASLGQTIIIENVVGASRSLGVGRVARAPPDGYTLVVGLLDTHVANGAVYKLKYDVLNDFEPISLIATQPFLIVAKKAMPADDLKGLITWLKVNPGKASAGTAGVGATDHVGGALFQNVTGTRFQFVPYRGGGPAVQDLVAGQIDIMFESPTITLPQARSGQIKGFAVTAKSRLAGAPEIPTVDEAGLPGFYLSFWLGLWAPKGTPKDDQQTSEALAAYQKAEIEKWWPIFEAWEAFGSPLGVAPTRREDSYRPLGRMGLQPYDQFSQVFPRHRFLSKKNKEVVNNGEMGAKSFNTSY